MLRFGDNRGMTTVFVLIIMASMVALVFAFIHGASLMAEKSMARGFIHLGSRSVLSEYNSVLKDRYNIFATDLDYREMEGRLRYYLESNLSDHGLIPMEVDNIQIDLSEYSLVCVDQLEKQIIDAALFPPVYKNHGCELSYNREWSQTALGNSLPSQGAGTFFFNIDLLNITSLNFKEIIKSGGSKALVNEYIIKYFNYNEREEWATSGYFSNEIEYILYGKSEDQSNLKRYQIDYIAFRTLLNLVHIKSDPKKMEILLLAAAAITPGPEAPITQLVLASAWAAAEGYNDWKLIINDHGVPLVKGLDDWALSFKQIDKIASSSNYIEPKGKSSFKYVDYLRLFLIVQKREIQLLRVMDIMQINMAGLQSPCFLIKEHYVGFDLLTRINGKTYHAEEFY